MHSPIYRFLPLSLLLSGCGSFDEPTAKDAAPIFGCYRSDEAPPLAISADGIRPYGFDKPVPFHYERRTVGMIVRAPFMADTGKDGSPLLLPRSIYIGCSFPMEIQSSP
jgi:hypothetical protein